MWRSSAATTNVMESTGGLGAMQRSSSTHFLAANNNNNNNSNNNNERWTAVNSKNSNGNDAKISLHVNYRYQQQPQSIPTPIQQQYQNGNSRERTRPVSMYEQQPQHYYRATNNGDFVARMSPAAALGVGVSRSESLFFGNNKAEQRHLQQQHQQQQHQYKQRRRQSPSELVCTKNNLILMIGKAHKLNKKFIW